MKNPEKRNHAQLHAWKRKGGEHDSDDIKSNAKKQRSKVQDEIEAAFKEYDEALYDSMQWDDMDYLNKVSDQDHAEYCEDI